MNLGSKPMDKNEKQKEVMSYFAPALVVDCRRIDNSCLSYALVRVAMEAVLGTILSLVRRVSHWYRSSVYLMNK